jgi:hypothetical protein
MLVTSHAKKLLARNPLTSPGGGGSFAGVKLHPFGLYISFVAGIHSGGLKK